MKKQAKDQQPERHSGAVCKLLSPVEEEIQRHFENGDLCIGCYLRAYIEGHVCEACYQETFAKWLTKEQILEAIECLRESPSVS